MLAWWRNIGGVDRVDLGVLLHNGAFIDAHADVLVDEIPLPWARAKNAAHAEIYVRPARGRDWALVFLDDLARPRADAIARKYGCLVVETSREGGCHLWLRVDRALDEAARKRAQAWLATRLGADRRSHSGEHFGRLAGFRNWKRGGQWVNVLHSTTGAPWHPTRDMAAPEGGTLGSSTSRSGNADGSPSGKEWGWVRGRIEHGHDLETIEAELRAQAHARGKRHPDSYARRTLRRASRS